MILDVAERVARGHNTEWGRGDGPKMKQAVELLQSKLVYLSPQAAAGWKSNFADVLDRAHSMRVSSIDKDYKSQLRPESACMACGRFEHNCMRKLCLGGPFRSSMWHKGVNELDVAWDQFLDDYNSTFENSLPSKGSLIQQDLGSFIIGETCLRKAQLYFTCRTLLLDLVYDAAHTISHLDTPPKPSVMYCIDDTRRDRLIQRLDDLETAIAKENIPVPPIGTDTAFWDKIDRARERASNFDKVTEAFLVSSRSQESLQEENSDYWCRMDQNSIYSLRGTQVSKCDWDNDSCSSDLSYGNQKHAGCQSSVSRGLDDSEEEQSDADSPCRKSGSQLRRKRRCVIEDEEEEETCAQEQTQPRRSLRVQGISVEENTQNAPKAAVSVEAAPARAQNVHNLARPRQFTGAASIAASQRVPDGRLASRREALAAGLTLATSLVRERRDSDAAVVTSMAFVIQELMDKVGQ